MTSFGGSLLVEPNPIDFDKVLVEFQQLSETGNIAVIVAIAVVLLCYMTVLVVVRKFDKEDVKNVSVELGFAIVLTERALQYNPFTFMIWSSILSSGCHTSFIFFVKKS